MLRVRWLAGCQVEDGCFDGGIVDLPRNDARTARRGREPGDLGGGAANGKVVVEPGLPGLPGSDPRDRRVAGLASSAAARWVVAAAAFRPAINRSPKESAIRLQIDQPGWALVDQLGALGLAAHGAQVAVPRVVHDVLVPDALAVDLGDEPHA